uniref:Putative secreted protein n=1 Tax=Anopheles triannulatus TaxID=58253 RepID=A0A2M4B4Q3_9DIPT
MVSPFFLLLLLCYHTTTGGRGCDSFSLRSATHPTTATAQKKTAMDDTKFEPPGTPQTQATKLKHNSKIQPR